MKIAPGSAIRFFVFEMLKTAIVEDRGAEKSDIGASGRLISGGFAGALCHRLQFTLWIL